QFTITSQDVSCYGGNDGSATVAVSYGVAPYTYTWNTTPVQNTATASNLPAGTHTVTVTDGISCSKSEPVTITQPAAPLTATISAYTDVLCFNTATGTATVNVTGGTPPYTYSWNTAPVQNTAAVSNLPIGSYTVTITDSKNCVTTTSVTISQPTDITVTTLSTSPSNCGSVGNGTATVSVTGGTTPYTYSWNTVPAQNTTMASNLAPGTYTVT